MNRKQNSLMRFSRTERLAQLSEQEIVIERKKREIQAKIEAQKKKETEEALKKLDSSKESKISKFGFLKKSSWSGNENLNNKNNEKTLEQVKESLTNAFSNDGSFLDQFKKLSKSGLSSDNVDVQTLTLEKEKEFKKFQGADKKFFKNHIIENEKKDVCRDVDRSVKGNCTLINDNNKSCFNRQPLDSKIQLQLLPPAFVQLVPKEQGAAIVPSAKNLDPLVPSYLDEVSKIQATQKQTPTFNRNNFQLNSFPSSNSNTVKPMPHVQVSGMHLDSESKNQNDLRASKLSHSSFPTTSLNCIQPPLPITPQNIPPPSPTQVQNIPPLPKPPKDSELPKYRTESISLSLKANTTKKLEAIPNPLEVDQPPSPKKSSCTFSEKKDILNSSQNFCSTPISENASDVKESLRISSAFYDQDEDVDNFNEKCRHSAQLVARCGDDFEDSLRERNQKDPNLRFLFEKNSKEYMAYRQLVLKYRRREDSSEHESSEKPQKKLHEEESKEKMFSNNFSKTKFLQTRTSESGSYVIDALTSERLGTIESKDDKKLSKADDDGKHQNKTTENMSKECGYPPSLEQTPLKKAPEDKIKESEMEISDEVKTEERRKRKRKSRWGDVATTSSLTVTGKINVQPTGKLPLPKSTLLSQLTRSDPGLIQYARQTFGSTNLSEEDWKKAEDHYKINLLYQDMVKKRAEVEKLERQGKFKYEYDSDEDTEGGTWEHKLRQQEMQATQLWAEELTRQAAGKHHIGDFLPPEELERFMEKYNAVKEGREPDLSDYKEYKLKEDNVGYRLLQKMGWNEGQGLGQDGSGIQNPVNKAITRHENQGLGVDRPDGLEAGDDEYDAYRKRMMLAYRFRPNPLNNPRRPYY